MTELDEDRLYEQLAEWRDHVEELLRQRGVPMVTVELLDVPGALTTKVSAGTPAVVAQLVSWSKPTLALFCPPDDENPFFSVGLVGGDDVVMICGKSPGDPEPDGHKIEPRDEVDWRPIRERLASALEELIHSDVWHFGGASDGVEDLNRVLAYAFPAAQTDEQTLALAREFPVWALLESMKEARTRQRDLHLQHLFENPKEIAEELYASADGPGLVRLPVSERIPVVYRILKDRDPCVTRASCGAVAREMGLRRLRD